MPIYEYRCTECGHQFEIHRRFSDEPLKECPKCQGKLAKVFHPAGVIFKGSGFYTTDYKAGGGGDSKSAGNGAGGEAAKSDKAESKKPESKSESSD